jgi:hypothetical protein
LKVVHVRRIPPLTPLEKDMSRKKVSTPKASSPGPRHICSSRYAEQINAMKKRDIIEKETELGA